MGPLFRSKCRETFSGGILEEWKRRGPILYLGERSLSNLIPVYSKRVACIFEAFSSGSCVIEDVC